MLWRTAEALTLRAVTTIERQGTITATVGEEALHPLHSSANPSARLKLVERSVTVPKRARLALLQSIAVNLDMALTLTVIMMG